MDGIVISCSEQPCYYYNCGHALATGSQGLVVFDGCSDCIPRSVVTGWDIDVGGRKVNGVGTVYIGGRSLEPTVRDDQPPYDHVRVLMRAGL